MHAHKLISQLSIENHVFMQMLGKCYVFMCLLCNFPCETTNVYVQQQKGSNTCVCVCLLKLIVLIFCCCYIMCSAFVCLFVPRVPLILLLQFHKHTHMHEIALFHVKTSLIFILLIFCFFFASFFFSISY